MFFTPEPKGISQKCPLTVWEGTPYLPSTLYILCIFKTYNCLNMEQLNPNWNVYYPYKEYKEFFISRKWFIRNLNLDFFKVLCTYFLCQTFFWSMHMQYNLERNRKYKRGYAKMVSGFWMFCLLFSTFLYLPIFELWA